jgi:hypoxanthine phosphoribosyltransferase
MNERPYTWEEFEVDVPRLIEMVRKASKRYAGFNGIYAVPRGGLVLGVRLSHELDLPMILGGVDKRTLVVDDIADSGNTLEPYRKRGCAILTIFKHNMCPFTPTFHVRENTMWVKFPWEKAPESSPFRPLDIIGSRISG